MAAALRVLDLAAEVLAEVPYMALAGWVLWRWWAGGASGAALPVMHTPGALWPAMIALAVGLALLVWRQLRTTRLGRRLRAEAHLLGRELKRQRVGFPAAFALHVVGWGLSGVQVWLAARVMGVPLSLWQALAIESAATSARVILFFVPGGLGMQEAGAGLALRWECQPRPRWPSRWYCGCATCFLAWRWPAGRCWNGARGCAVPGCARPPLRVSIPA